MLNQFGSQGTTQQDLTFVSNSYLLNTWQDLTELFAFANEHSSGPRVSLQCTCDNSVKSALFDVSFCNPTLPIAQWYSGAQHLQMRFGAMGSLPSWLQLSHKKQERNIRVPSIEKRHRAAEEKRLSVAFGKKVSQVHAGSIFQWLNPGHLNCQKRDTWCILIGRVSKLPTASDCKQSQRSRKRNGWETVGLLDIWRPPAGEARCTFLFDASNSVTTIWHASEK